MKEAVKKYGNPRGRMDSIDKTLDKLLDFSNSNFTDNELKFLHGVVTEDRGIILGDPDNLDPTKALSIRLEKSKRKGSDITPAEMKADIIEVLEAKTLDRAPLSREEINAVKLEKFDIIANSFDTEAGINEELEKRLVIQLRETVTEPIIRLYVDAIIDATRNGADTADLYSRLAESSTEGVMTSLKNNIQSNLDDIMRANPEQLIARKESLGNLAYSALEEEHEDEYKKELRADVANYISNVKRAAANTSKSTAIAEITKLNIAFADKHSTLDENSLATAKQQAITLVADTGKKEWFYTVKQCLKSIVGASDVQKIDKAFAAIAAKEVPRTSMVIENVTVAGAPSSARAVVSDNRRNSRG